MLELDSLNQDLHTRTHHNDLEIIFLYTMVRNVIIRILTYHPGGAFMLLLAARGREAERVLSLR